MHIWFIQPVFIHDIIHSLDSDGLFSFIQSKSSYAKIISSYIDIDSISVSTEELTFMDYSQLEMGLVTMDLSSFSQLKSFECGDNSFNSVRQFIINGLNELESISIGMNSFTLSENSYSERLNREFHLKNCLSLRELSIDRYSFSDYHTFELNNLPNLKSIVIGSSSESANFYFVESIELNDLPSLESIEFGSGSFYSIHDIVLSSMIWYWYRFSLDLTQLKSIRLGDYSLRGDSNDDRKGRIDIPYDFMNTLTMKSTNEWLWIDNEIFLLSLPFLHLVHQTLRILDQLIWLVFIHDFIHSLDIPHLYPEGISASRPNHFQYAYLIHSTSIHSWYHSFIRFWSYHSFHSIQIIICQDHIFLYRYWFYLCINQSSQLH